MSQILITKLQIQQFKSQAFYLAPTLAHEFAEGVICPDDSRKKKTVYQAPLGLYDCKKSIL